MKMLKKIAVIGLVTCLAFAFISPVIVPVAAFSVACCIGTAVFSLILLC